MDVTSFDMDEQDEGDHHPTMQIFVRGPKSPDKSTQRNIKDIIHEYCKKHGLPIRHLAVAISDKFAAIEAKHKIEPRSKTPEINMKSPELRKCATSILSSHSAT